MEHQINGVDKFIIFPRPLTNDKVSYDQLDSLHYRFDTQLQLLYIFLSLQLCNNISGIRRCNFSIDLMLSRSTLITRLRCLEAKMQFLIFCRYCCFISVLTLFLMDFLTNRTLFGGQIYPLVILFFNRGLVFDVKGQNPKAQPSTLKIVALRIFWRIINSGKNPEMLKIRYLEIRLFIQKRPAKIKPRQVGCCGFL